MAGLIYQGDQYSVFHICARTRYVTCVLWPIQSSSQADQGGKLSQVCKHIVNLFSQP
jgi:hypothetical protein